MPFLKKILAILAFFAVKGSRREDSSGGGTGIPGGLPFWHPAAAICFTARPLVPPFLRRPVPYSPFPVPAFHVHCEINNVVSHFAEMRLTSTANGSCKFQVSGFRFQVNGERQFQNLPGCGCFFWQRSSHGSGPRQEPYPCQGLALPGLPFAFIVAALCGRPAVVSVGRGQPPH